MAWHVTRSTYSVHVGILTLQGYNRSGLSRPVIRLYPGLVDKDLPIEDNPLMALTFLNQFVKADGNYPTLTLRHQIRSTRQRSNQLTNYIMDQFSSELKRLGLYEAIRVTC